VNGARLTVLFPSNLSTDCRLGRTGFPPNSGANLRLFGNELPSSGIYVFTGGIGREIRELSDGFERLLAIERVRTLCFSLIQGYPSPE
jgi:hypothetical protein